ncbi:unnamed protein product [Tuber aestivum]|uniref:Ubiquitin 3 binding protein But2 C-terminal domain-containing protein n=1 Tax=Tuber aestivum TaxID=59557 RepID=A0A292PQV6_9PEZI|nr:unnamed protein product [Tuber aestivum]
MRVSATVPLLFFAIASYVNAKPGDIPVNPALEFTPGLSSPQSCVKAPNGDICPPKLMNGNLIVTPLNLHLTEEFPDKPPSLPFNTFRVGFGMAPNISEETTLSVFDFPGGMESNNCSFHIVTNDGDNLAHEVLYSVWRLKDNGKDVSMQTTWNTKPVREETTFQFIYGSGFGGEKWVKPSGNLNSFKCPPGGKVVFETSQTAKIAEDPWRPDATINAGGNGGLCIEIANTATFT